MLLAELVFQIVRNSPQSYQKAERLNVLILNVGLQRETLSNSTNFLIKTVTSRLRKCYMKQVFCRKELRSQNTKIHEDGTLILTAVHFEN